MESTTEVSDNLVEEYLSDATGGPVSFPPLAGTAACADEGTVATVASSSAKPTQYTVRYQDNNSKKWDGQKDGDWLLGLYDHSELVPGKKLELPWRTKGGKTTYWKAIVVDNNGKNLYIYLHTYVDVQDSFSGLN